MPSLVNNFPSGRFSFYIELSQHAVQKSILGRAGGCHRSLSLTCAEFSAWRMLVLSVFLMKRSQFYVREISFIVGQTQTCKLCVKVVGEQITTKSLGFLSPATVTYGPADHLTSFQSPV